MAEKVDDKEMVTAQELITSMVYAQEAVVRLLERKGILTQKEVLDEIKKVRIEQEKKAGTASH
jgi:hypothetical protein